MHLANPVLLGLPHTHRWVDLMKDISGQLQLTGLPQDARRFKEWKIVFRRMLKAMNSEDVKHNRFCCKCSQIKFHKTIFGTYIAGNLKTAGMCVNIVLEYVVNFEIKHGRLRLFTKKWGKNGMEWKTSWRNGLKIKDCWVRDDCGIA